MSTFPFENLRSFLEALEKNEELHRIQAEVDPVLEMAEITDRITKQEGPALFFEKPKGSTIPVISNLLGSHKRIQLALGVKSYEEIAERIQDLLNPPTPITLMEKVQLLPKLMELGKFFPKVVKKAPCQEVVLKNPSLDFLPILKCWPKDGGRYITWPLVITKDPENGKRNIGCYRMQVFDEKTTGMHWQIHKDGARHFRKYKALGKRMEVAVAIGVDPATLFSAVCPLPPDIDEALFSGFLRKAPLEMTKGISVDLEIPAESEIVLEGYVDPEETRLEGPFGDHTGFYSIPEPYPVFHITTITHRKDPIYLTTLVGKPPQEDAWIGKAIERIFLPMIRLVLPEIKDMNFPVEAVFHNCVIVSIKKAYPGHAKKVIHALWGLGQMIYTRTIIVVDETIDVQNLKEVAWWVFNCFDPPRSFVFSEGPLDALDHASNVEKYGVRVGIDATKPFPEEGRTRAWPDDIKMDEGVVQQVLRRWGEFGFSLKETR
jgi:4-hydroxy-3-polyprenylbenzoate decarboxylase